MPQIHLLADVGGTNTRVAFASDGALQRDAVKRYRNKDHSDLYQILQAYLQHLDLSVDAICVDIAGPVQNGRGELTNRKWTITPEGLKSASGAAFALVINDMHAQGLALDTLPEASRIPCILPTRPALSSTRMVVNVGTGFNSAVVLDQDGEILVPGSETGHVDLPAQTAKHFDLHQYITEQNGFASVEDVLSGRGVEMVYKWCADGTKRAKTSYDILSSIDTDAAAQKTLETAISIFGQTCGNLALTHLPFDGIYLVGGMAQALAPHFERFDFEAAFKAKGRFSEFMNQFGVTLVADDHAPLVGCIAALQTALHDVT